ncbi:xanthine dehydrogenase family protein subunit M [Acuticoccus sp. I52.16.1]|uniref:FAD binding domain-containing protein n=1 Tax=Acuticoccus sp. I52.16.1 TaxID=2928472 RepID=UPI001FD1714E|nr:FAD binding domain-containing protein [Acuticoccus sp. I52.16.1]UOM35099.1 FAD binding domain-containing protein [Acuticoccus sp. I52.16.1]
MAPPSPLLLDDALAALGSGSARVLAGGTDLFAAAAGPRLAGPVVDIKRIPGMATIEAGDAGWRIGAGVTWSQLAGTEMPAAFDALKAAARQVGSIQIQNRATLAGNLCNASPAADGVPALLALDAAVEIAGPDGSRTLPLGEFLLGPRRTALAPGEIVTAVVVPAQPAGAVGAFAKLGARRYLVISIAMVAVVIAAEAGRITAARVAVGACSPVAVRLAALEAALLGVTVDDAPAVPVAAHLAPLAPIDDVRAGAAYRREAALVLVRRTLAAAAAMPGSRPGRAS